MISAARKRGPFRQGYKRLRTQLNAPEKSVHQRKQTEEKPLTRVQLLAILGEITFALSSTLDLHMVKQMACGFRNRKHYRTAIYFHCGGLDLYPR